MRQHISLITTVIAALVVSSAACNLAAGQEETAGVRVTEPPQHFEQRTDLQALYGYEALERQYNFLSQMPAVNVEYNSVGVVTRLNGSTGIYLKDVIKGLEVGKPSPEVLRRLGPALLASGTEELRVRQIKEPPSQTKWAGARRRTEQVIRFQEYIGGLEVLAGGINIGVNEQTGEVTAVAGNFLPNRGLIANPVITAADARKSLEAKLRDSSEDTTVSFPDVEPRLAYAFEEIEVGGGRGGVLVWVIHATRTRDGADQSLIANISAVTGEVVGMGAYQHAYRSSRLLSPDRDGYLPRLHL